MRSLAAAVTTALAAGHAVLVQFVKIDFPSGTIALNSSNWTFTHGGTTYQGAYGLGAISPIADTPGELPGLQLELQRVDAAMIATALDDADQVQGTLVTISTAILDSTTYAIIDVVTDWVGYADKMLISEDGETASIGMTAESKAVDLLRGNPLTYSHADQTSLYATDRAFEYANSQAEAPVVWPSRDWFHK